jgi:hypothetical protein
MAHSTMRKSRLDSKYVSKPKNRNNRQRMLDEKLIEVIDLPECTQSKLRAYSLKVEKLYSLELKYNILVENKKIGSLENDLQELNTALIESRSHTSRHKRLSDYYLNHSVQVYLRFGQFCSTDSLLKHQEKNAKMQEVFWDETSPKSQQRSLLLRIYIIRYDGVVSGKNAKRMWQAFKNLDVKGQMDQDWQSDEKDGYSKTKETIKSWFVNGGKLPSEWKNHVYASGVSVVNYVRETVMSMYERILSGITPFFREMRLNLIKYVIWKLLIILIGGFFSGVAMWAAYKLIEYMCRGKEIPEGECIVGQGDEEPVSKTVLTRIGDLMHAQYDTVMKFDSEAFYNKFGGLCSKFNSIETCFTKIWNYTKPMMSFVFRKITGKPLFDLDVLSEEVGLKTNFLNQARKKYLETRRFQDDESAKEVYEAGEYLRDKVSQKIHIAFPSLSSVVTQTLLMCSDVLDAAAEYVFGAHSRIMPVWVHLVGAPKCGKSTLSSMLIKWIRHATGLDDGRKQCWFDRKINNEYWEGYTKQFAVTYDDYLQANDLETRRQNALELIYAVNVNPFHLHYASIADKKNNYFDSPFVFSTSNYEATGGTRYLPGDLGLTDYHALYRRMQVKYLMRRRDLRVDEKYENLYEESKATCTFTKIDDEGNLREIIDLPQLIKVIVDQQRSNTADFIKFSECDTADIMEAVMKAAEVGGKSTQNFVPVEKKEDKSKPFLNKPVLSGKKPDLKKVLPAKTWRKDSKVENATTESILDLPEGNCGGCARTPGNFDSPFNNNCFACNIANVKGVFQCNMCYSKYGLVRMWPKPIFRAKWNNMFTWRQFDNLTWLEKLYVIEHFECPYPLVSWLDLAQEPQGQMDTDYNVTIISDDEDNQAEDEYNMCDYGGVYNPTVFYDETAADPTKVGPYYDSGPAAKGYKESFDVKDPSASPINFIRWLRPNLVTDVNYASHLALFMHNPMQYVEDSYDIGLKNNSCYSEMVKALKSENELVATRQTVFSLRNFTSLFNFGFKPKLYYEVEQSCREGTLGSYITEECGEKGEINDERFLKVLMYIKMRMEANYQRMPEVDDQLDWFVYKFSVQARQRSSYRNKFTLYFDLEGRQELQSVYAYWIDQAYNGYLSDEIKICKSASFMTTFRMEIEGNTIKAIPCPGSQRPSLTAANELARYKLEGISVPEIKSDYYSNSRVALMVIASVTVVLLATAAIFGIVKAILAFFGKESILGESYDKNTENVARKQLAKRGRARKIVPTKGQKGKIFSTKVGGQTQIVKINGQSGSNTDLLVTYARNTEYVGFQTDVGVDKCFVTFIQSNVCVTSAHLFRTKKIKKMFFYWGRTPGDAVVECDFGTDFTYTLPDGRDIAIITLSPDLMPPYKNLVKHLWSKKDMENLQNIEGISRINFNQAGVMHVLNADTARRVENSKITFSGALCSASQMFFVPLMQNQAGDCGYPIATVNNKYPHKLLGVHTAGSRLGSYFTPIYKEDFDPEGQCFEGNDPEPEDVYPESVARKIQFKPNFEILPGAKVIADVIENDKPKIIFEPGKTSLSKTYIEETIYYNDKVLQYPLEVCHKMPALLKPLKDLDENGEVVTVDPTANALKKLEGRNSPGSMPIGNKDKHWKGVFHDGFRAENVQIVSRKIAINGKPGSEFFGPIDLSGSSSTGFSENGIVLKEMIVGPDGDRTASEEFGKLLDKRNEKFYSQGKVPPYFGTMTKKDELRNPKKVRVPRLFVNGAKAPLIEARERMGTLFEEILRHEGKGDIYIGINPHSFQWKRLHIKLKMKSKIKGIADDKATYDWNIRPVHFIESFSEQLLKRGVAKNVVDQIVLVLRSTLWPYLMHRGKLIRIKGMPSGSYITAVINSVYNSWMNRVLWDIANPDLDFDDHVAMACAGDDNCQTVSDDLPEDLWNGQLVAKLSLKYFAMTTTSIYKDGREVPKFMPLEWDGTEGCCQFLKRYFRVENDNVYPLLDEGSITSMVHWIKLDLANGRTKQVCIMDNLKTALQELCYYPREKFDRFNEFVRIYCQQQRWPSIDVSFDLQRQKYLEPNCA